ncbi:MAG: hypothetical protein IT426_06665 [Pirellulales bacterium]|nr:hypothetical protein [Pirellulales bacterium]
MRLDFGGLRPEVLPQKSGFESVCVVDRSMPLRRADDKFDGDHFHLQLQAARGGEQSRFLPMMSGDLFKAGNEGIGDAAAHLFHEPAVHQTGVGLNAPMIGHDHAPWEYAIISTCPTSTPRFSRSQAPAWERNVRKAPTSQNRQPNRARIEQNAVLILDWFKVGRIRNIKVVDSIWYLPIMSRNPYYLGNSPLLLMLKYALNSHILRFGP